jgi:hypothetical protein
MNTNETTTPTKTRRSLPRFDYLSRRPDPRALSDPLPPLLVAKLADTPELRQHTELVGHFRAAEERVVTLSRELEAAKREDDERRLAALTKDRKPPAKRAEGVEAQLEEARKDAAMLGSTVVESAEKLLQRAAPLVDEADAESSARVESALDEIEDLISATLAAFDRASEAATESGWIRVFDLVGSVTPWGGARGRVQPGAKARNLVVQAAGVLTEERASASEAAAASKDAHEQRLRELPPGAIVCRGGQEFRVGKDGELEEIQR